MKLIGSDFGPGSLDGVSLNNRKYSAGFSELGLGEKLWKEKSRGFGLIVRSVGAEGAVMEGTWTS